MRAVRGRYAGRTIRNAFGGKRIPQHVSEIDFRELLASSPNPYVLLNRDLEIAWMNDAYLRVTMRDRDGIIGRNMFDAFPSEGESYRQLAESLDRVLRTGEPDEIAHIRYDIANPDGTFDTHFWSATHTPLKGDDGQVRYILQHTVNITELETLRRTIDEAGVVERAKKAEERYRTASEELERARMLLEQAPGFVAVLSGPEHSFVLANAAYRRLLGGRRLIGRTIAEALPEVVEQGFLRILDEVRATGKPYFGNRELVTLVDPETGKAEESHLEFIFQPISEKSGEVTGILIQGYDVSEEVEAEERQKLLINELNHRVKNTLAIVQGLAQQSFKTDQGDHGLDVFAARLAALASAHNLLTEFNWKKADVEKIVRRSLEATAGTQSDRYSLTGPKVTLDPQSAVALAMVVHELATNALKYGALSDDKGSIAITWDRRSEEDGSRLIFDWRESGGPAIEAPTRRGFGSRLISRAFGNRGDCADLTYHEDGLHCRLETKL
nr:PAS domain-containing protein [Qipengyuania gaetbuli]